MIPECMRSETALENVAPQHLPLGSLMGKACRAVIKGCENERERAVYSLYERILNDRSEGFCGRWEYRDAMAHLVSKVQKGEESSNPVDEKEVEYYERLKSHFKEAIEAIPEKKIGELQTKFIDAFNRPGSPFSGCSLDETKEHISISYDQLKFITELIKREYPGFFYMAFGEEEQLLINRLAGRISLRGNFPLQLMNQHYLFNVASERYAREKCEKEGNFSLFSRAIEPSREKIDLTKACEESITLIKAQFVAKSSQIIIAEKGRLWPNGDEKSLCSLFSTIIEFLEESFDEAKKCGSLKEELQNSLAMMRGDTPRQGNSAIGDPVSEARHALLSIKSDLPKPFTERVEKNISSSDIPLRELYLEVKFLQFLLFFNRENNKEWTTLRRLHHSHKLKPRENSPPLSLQRGSGLEHTFSTSLHPLSTSINSELIMNSKDGVKWQVSENFDRKIHAGAFTSIASYEKLPEGTFRIDSDASGAKFMKRLTWSCQLPKKLLVTMREAFPSIEARDGETIGEKMRSFAKGLEQLASYKLGNSYLHVTPEIAVEEKYTGRFSYTYVKKPSRTLPENSEVLDRLELFFSMGKEAFESYCSIKEGVSKSNEKKVGEWAEKLYLQLIEAKKALDGYISDNEGKINHLQRQRFNQLKAKLDEYSLLLEIKRPKIEEMAYSPDEQTINKLWYSLFQSDRPEHINWKAMRYLSILMQLCERIKSKLQFEKDERVDLIGQSSTPLSQSQRSSEGEKMLQRTLSQLVEKVQRGSELLKKLIEEQSSSTENCRSSSSSTPALISLNQNRYNYTTDFIDRIRAVIAKLENESKEINRALNRFKARSQGESDEEERTLPFNEKEIELIAPLIEKISQQYEALSMLTATRDCLKSMDNPGDSLNDSLEVANGEIEKLEEEIEATTKNLEMNITHHQELLAAVYEICEEFYTETDLEKEGLTLLKLAFNYGEKNFKKDFEKERKGDKDPELFLTKELKKHHYYQSRLPDSKTAPFLHRIFKSLNEMLILLGFDPNKQANLPQRHATLRLRNSDGRVKEIAALAFGSPTIEKRETLNPLYKSTALNEEFTSFIKSLEKKGKRHLFVSIQNISENSTWENSKHYVGVDDQPGRVKEFLEFAKKYPETLFPIVLSMDSDFFKQEGRYERASNSDEFKKNLLEEFLKGDPKVTGNKIPKEVRDRVPELEKECEDWIELYHTLLFNGKEELTNIERQTFINLFQNFLVTYLCFKLDIDSLNFTCKDGIDRGMAIFTMWIALQGILHGLEKDGDFAIRLSLYLLIRALFTRKRAIIKERADRAIQTMEFYEKNRERLKICYQEAFGDCSITPLTPPLQKE